MIQILALSLLVSALSACVTPPGQVSPLPKKFIAEQVLEIETKRESVTLRAQLQFAGSLQALILIHPLFGSPLVEIKSDSGVIHEKWHVEKRQLPLAPIVASINEIYSIASPVVGQRYPVAGGGIVIDSIKLYGGCRFPQQLTITFDSGAKLTVRTQSVQCG